MDHRLRLDGDARVRDLIPRESSLGLPPGEGWSLGTRFVVNVARVALSVDSELLPEMVFPSGEQMRIGSAH